MPSAGPTEYKSRPAGKTGNFRESRTIKVRLPQTCPGSLTNLAPDHTKIAFTISTLKGFCYDHIFLRELKMTEQDNRSDRPWGSFFVLEDGERAKVKRLVVNPGQRLSLQSHTKRDEHWVVIRGIARVTLDDTTSDYNYGEHIFIGRGVKHRVSCPCSEPLEIIEVQLGESFAEEDIIRYSDDYGRVDG
jgi:mannose-6-phosphate isomerase-like protein (cupin superfamily)